MIKFFKKIRQSLLSEGKTGKYLKYASGEIILVVIGIFIAVQINNLNEDRKDAIILKDLLELLESDLKEDLAKLKALDAIYSQMDIQTDILLDQFKTLKDIDLETSDNLINLLIERSFTSQRNAYDILKDSGQLSNLTIALQNSLMRYYSTVLQIKARENISNTFISNRIEPLVFRRYSNFFNKSNPSMIIQEVYANDPRPLDDKVFYEMFADKELEVLCWGRRYQNKKQWALYQMAIDDINKIITLINNV